MNYKIFYAIFLIFSSTYADDWIFFNSLKNYLLNGDPVPESVILWLKRPRLTNFEISAVAANPVTFMNYPVTSEIVGPIERIAPINLFLADMKLFIHLWGVFRNNRWRISNRLADWLRSSRPISIVIEHAELQQTFVDR